MNSKFVYFLVVICLLQLSAFVALSQGRENWFPNRGNVGIGTRTPSKDLEVIGDVNVTQTLYTNSLQTIGLNATTLTVSQDASIGRNLLVTGNVGIGVSSSLEKLEVGGNIKASQNLISDKVFSGDGQFSRSMSVNQDLLVSGKTGLGVLSPVEKLEVGGNAKISQTVFSDKINTGDGIFSRNLSVTQNFNVSGKTGLNVVSPLERLEVGGNIKATQSLLSDKVNSGDGAFSRALQVGQNFNVNGNTGLNVATPNERLEVGGNVKISQTLFSDIINSGDGVFSRSIQATQNLIVNGNTGLGVTLPGEKLEVGGNIKATGNLTAADIHANTAYFTSLQNSGNLSITGNLGVGVSSPLEKVEVVGNMKISGNVTGADFSGDNGNFSSIQTTGNIISNGSVGIGVAPGNYKLNVVGDSYMNGTLTAENLTVRQNLTLNGRFSLTGPLGVGVASPQASLHVSGDGKFDGNITANKITVNAIEIAGATQSSSGSSLSLGDNLVVNGSIAIGTAKVEGYKLSVNGKIRASSIIKVYPETEWSDFVFKKNYKLRSLEDVDNYIQKHGHLPDMPSAKEVEKEGIDLGSMDAKLLQKIEELTLHMIELKKLNDTFKKENEDIKNEIKQLKQGFKAKSSR